MKVSDNDYEGGRMKEKSRKIKQTLLLNNHRMTEIEIEMA